MAHGNGAERHTACSQQSKQVVLRRYTSTYTCGAAARSYRQLELHPRRQARLPLTFRVAVSLVSPFLSPIPPRVNLSGKPLHLLVCGRDSCNSVTLWRVRHSKSHESQESLGVIEYAISPPAQCVILDQLSIRPSLEPSSLEVLSQGCLYVCVLNSVFCLMGCGHDILKEASTGCENDTWLIGFPSFQYSY